MWGSQSRLRDRIFLLHTTPKRIIVGNPYLNSVFVVDLVPPQTPKAYLLESDLLTKGFYVVPEPGCNPTLNRPAGIFVMAKRNSGWPASAIGQPEIWANLRNRPLTGHAQAHNNPHPTTKPTVRSSAGNKNALARTPAGSGGRKRDQRTERFMGAMKPGHEAVV